MTPRLQAQDPGAQQDAEAAREKLLKAADQLDNIQANSEATKTSVDGVKTDVAALQASVTKLQSDNAALRQQIADLQAAVDEFKAEQIKARQVLIDKVAGMIAAGKDPGAAKTVKKKKEAPLSEVATETSVPTKTPDAPASATDLAPPPDAISDTSSEPVKPQKGYYHVVAEGETLRLICTAYREHGVDVTLSDIRKANGLTETSVLKVGQKLFIPKPGT
ncbi:MAG TPA: LysM peptidoglycan-binding domain-containing protein [Candidatus Methylacidiphilales bacterium]|nr:LysM peptidoglycan-binding domain-containing protein [Candidatus Methylacidiphilales bacterium]